MIRTLRWLLVAPMAVFGWSIAFSGTLALHSLIFMFCPPEQQISGMCTAPWAATTEGILIILGAAFSGLLVVVSAVIAAPAYKTQVGLVIYGLGLGVAVWAYLETAALSALIAAGLGGLIAVWRITKKYGWRRASRFRQYELFI